MTSLQEAIDKKAELEAEILKLIQVYEYHFLPVTSIELVRIYGVDGTYARTEMVQITAEV